MRSIGDAIEDGGTETRFARHSASLAQRVAAVDGNNYRATCGRQLEEFAMLLRNDAVEGKEINDSAKCGSNLSCDEAPRRTTSTNVWSVSRRDIRWPNRASMFRLSFVIS